MSVSSIIDPATGLDTDLPKHADMLGEIVATAAVQKVLFDYAATPEIAAYNRQAVATTLKLLGRTQHRYGKVCRGVKGSESGEWWKAYAFHIRSQLCYVLTEDLARKNAAVQMAFARGKSLLATSRWLRQENRDCNLWLKDRLKQAELHHMFMAGAES